MNVTFQRAVAAQCAMPLMTLLNPNHSSQTFASRVLHQLRTLCVTRVTALNVTAYSCLELDCCAETLLHIGRRM